ncbi:MAG: hypothetical protein H6978_01790 [Gammaproteobacteria bacterium]|nr:hypothetical protein [Gammaproteobacteria bacterium]
MVAERPLAAGLAALLIGGASPVAWALEIERGDFSYHDGRYDYTVIADLTADIDTVRGIINDYAGLARLNDSFIDSAIEIEFADGSVQRRLLIKQCVLFFCFDLRLVERVTRPDADTTVTRIVPDLSSFKDGITTWTLNPVDGNHVRLTITGSQAPDFWIPPLLGPLLLKSTFMREARETCEGIERLANSAIQ